MDGRLSWIYTNCQFKQKFVSTIDTHADIFEEFTTLINERHSQRKEVPIVEVEGALEGKLK